MRYGRLNQPEKLAVAENPIDTAHRIDLDKLGTATRYMNRLVKEAIEIRLHPDEVFNLSHK
jgi:hypothetical protein